MRCLAMDGMGVMFQAADDVADLLIPFIRDSGGCSDVHKIESAYLDASLGVTSPDEFWVKVGLDPALEDIYLARHTLMPGVLEFLGMAADLKIPVWCLSNDVDRWSMKLRTGLGLGNLLAGAVISSEVQSRKPDRRIYDCLLDRSGFSPDEVIFIDDRPSNVEAARRLGIHSLHFSPETGYRTLAEKLFDQPLAT